MRILELDLQQTKEELDVMKEKRRRLLEDFNESVMEIDGLQRNLKDEKHETEYVKEISMKEFRTLENTY